MGSSAASASSWAERTSAIEGDAMVTTSDETDSTAIGVDSSDSMSECFQTYLEVLISSTSGLRKETCFSVGKMGRVWVMENRRRSVRGIGLFRSIEDVVCDSLYGIAPESEKVEAEDIDEELGVRPSAGSGVVGDSGTSVDSRRGVDATCTLFVS